MKKVAAADVVIFGGGIAGLWLLHRLRQAGFSALLFDSGALGGGQTHKAQGIIHGGIKYVLQGKMTKDAQAITDMPALWKACLQGCGEIDLSGVPILSMQQYLWAPHKFTSKLTGFLASAALTSKVQSLTKADYPKVFQHSAFKGDVFALDEMVVDVPALIRELVKANQDAVYMIEPLSDEALKFDDEGCLVSATVYLAGKSIEIAAQQFIFTAGAGNEVIVKKLNDEQINMQRRPLHMVLVKLPFDCPLYAHCLSMGSRPRITITTHHMQDGGTVWYLGGLLAEEGVSRNSEQQIAAASQELKALFPWLDFTEATFATFMVDRAESKQRNGLKPETAYMKAVKNMVIAWPTKLALAPLLANEVMQYLANMQLTSQWFDTRELRAWPMPPLAKPVWEYAFCNDAV